MYFFFESHIPLATTLLTFYADNVSSFFTDIFLLSPLPRYISMEIVINIVVDFPSMSSSNGTIAAESSC